MIAVIVPSHNQSKHIENIIRSYEKQTLRPDILLFVFDRCTDDSIDIISKVNTDLNVSYTIKKCGQNFSAGMTRDYGVTKIEEYEKENNIKFKMILFTDGDCYPNETVIEDHFENCMIREEPIVSCGRREMQDINGVYHDDERMNEWAEGFSFVNRNGRVLISRAVTLDNIFTYSCNLAFNRFAINLCKNINMALSNSSRVFNSEFDGYWGGEDNFISDCLFKTGNWITLSNYRSYVKHPWHEPSPVKRDERKALLKLLSDKLTMLIINETIYGPITHVEKCRYFPPPLFLSGPINNIQSIISYNGEYTKNSDIFFYSRNLVFSNPITEVHPGRQREEELFKLYELSAFRQLFLTSDSLIEDSDLSKYRPVRCLNQSSYLK